jgi:hypothetical protein
MKSGEAIGDKRHKVENANSYFLGRLKRKCFLGIGMSYTQSNTGLFDLSMIKANLFKNKDDTIGHPKLLQIGFG